MSSPTTPLAKEHAKPSFRSFLRYFLGLGTWGFGGPIATVGYMQRDLVGGRGWVEERDFLNGVALGQTMPGPLAAQVVMWIGYLQPTPVSDRYKVKIEYSSGLGRPKVTVLEPELRLAPGKKRLPHVEYPVQ